MNVTDTPAPWPGSGDANDGAEEDWEAEIDEADEEADEEADKEVDEEEDNDEDYVDESSDVVSVESVFDLVGDDDNISGSEIQNEPGLPILLVNVAENGSEGALVSDVTMPLASLGRLPLAEESQSLQVQIPDMLSSRIALSIAVVQL